MNSRLLVSVSVLVATFALVAGNAAAAGNPHGIVLGVPKTVTVNYTNCSDPNGNPLPCITVPFSVTNNTGEDAECAVFVKEINFFAFDGTLAAGTAVAGELTTPYAGQKKLTFVLICDGHVVPAQKRHVRILA